MRLNANTDQEDQTAGQKFIKDGIVRRCTRSLVRQPELSEIVCHAVHCGA